MQYQQVNASLHWQEVKHSSAAIAARMRKVLDGMNPLSGPGVEAPLGGAADCCL